MSAPTIRCVLFDLDGTLADTAPDMIAALNAVRSAENLPAVPLAFARDHVSHGSAALIKLGFGAQQPEADYQRRIRHFLDYYRADLCNQTRLFDGMESVLEHLERNGLPWGVVTNKPAWLTEPLMQAMQLQQRAACIISGDSTAERKPHPLPMLTAARLAGADPAQCLYLGDAERDIAAGNAAGMTTLIAAWGYIDSGQTPQHWGADGSIEHPHASLAWL